MALALACAGGSLVSAPARAGWDPVPAADLAQTAPQVEPGAAAEILLWRVTINDVYDGDFSAHQEMFVRLKLFDDRAVQKYATVPFSYAQGTEIDEIQARTVRPDGTILEVPHKAFFDRAIYRRGRRRVRERSFAAPGLVPGAIVEYRVHLHTVDRFSHYLPIPLQREEPVRRLELYLHPLSLPDLAMNFQSFNSPFVGFSNEGGGTYRAILTNLRSFQREPLMPSDDQVMSWLLLFYRYGPSQSVEEYWRQYARELHDDFMQATKPDGTIRDAASRATAGATGDEERVRRLFDWSRSHVRNTSVDTAITEAQRHRLKANRSPGDILESGIGTWWEIDRVFAALARASRLDVRHAAINTRSDVPVDLKAKLTYFMRSRDVAVHIGDGWEFFDPGDPWIGFGMLPWDEEGATAIIAGPEGGLVATTPLTGESLSTRTSIARLTLDDEGTLEGTVRVILTGHVAADQREKEQDDTPSERVGAWTADLRTGLGAVDVLEPRIEARPASDAPYEFSCRIRAPGYAQRTERRIVLQPAVFRRQSPAMFPQTQRRYPVALSYPWTERDTVEIRLPDAYVPEALSDARPIVIQDVGRWELGVKLQPDGRTLVATRDFHFGEGGRLHVPGSAYPRLKSIFDSIRERDAQTLVLTKAAN